MRFAPVVLAALCVATLFLGLDRVGFLDWREARDAVVARELRQHREALTPLYGHEALAEKPLLAYAPEVLALRFTRVPAIGPSPLRSRQARAVLAVLLVLGTASLAAHHFGLRAAWFSAATLATSLGLPLAARTDGTQLMGALFGWAACAMLAGALFGGGARRELRLAVAYLALGAALASVGPLAALWPLGGLALYLSLAREPHKWPRGRWLAGFAVMAGVALPWYGAMVERHGAGFLVHALSFPYGVERPGPWFAGPVLAISFLVVGFFPWAVLLPGAMRHAAVGWPAGRRDVMPPSDDARREESVAHFLIACLMAALAPVALYPGPPIPAALPALPAAAILCGRFLDHLFTDPVRFARPITRAARMLVLIGTSAAVLLALLAERGGTHPAGTGRGAAADLRLLAALLLLTSWAPFLADFMGRRRSAAVLMALPVALGTPVVSLRVLPAMEDALSARLVAAVMNETLPPRAPLLLADPPPPTLRFYGARTLVVAESPARELRSLRASDGMTYLGFVPSRESEISRSLGVPLEILLRSPSLVLARVRAE